jgi:hypothetical protein
VQIKLLIATPNMSSSCHVAHDHCCSSVKTASAFARTYGRRFTPKLAGVTGGPESSAEEMIKHPAGVASNFPVCSLDRTDTAENHAHEGGGTSQSPSALPWSHRRRRTQLVFP